MIIWSMLNVIYGILLEKGNTTQHIKLSYQAVVLFLLVVDISKGVMAFTSDSRPKSGFDSIGGINNV